MKIDDFESWIEELRQRHFDISATTWRLLRLAGQYQSVVIKSQAESSLEVVINDHERHQYPLDHATGTFRMILARIASFYMEIGAANGKIALYGFEGKVEVEDNFGSVRQLEIEMRNRNEFYLAVRCPK